MLVDLFAYTEVFSVLDDVYTGFRWYLGDLGTPCYMRLKAKDHLMRLDLAWGLVHPGFVSLSETPDLFIAKANVQFDQPSFVYAAPKMGIEITGQVTRELFIHPSDLFEAFDDLKLEYPDAEQVTFHSQMRDGQVARFVRELELLAPTNFEAFDDRGYLRDDL